MFPRVAWPTSQEQWINLVQNLINIRGKEITNWQKTVTGFIHDLKKVNYIHIPAYCSLGYYFHVHEYKNLKTQSLNLIISQRLNTRNFISKYCLPTDGGETGHHKATLAQ